MGPSAPGPGQGTNVRLCGLFALVYECIIPAPGSLRGRVTSLRSHAQKQNTIPALPPTMNQTFRILGLGFQ